MLATKAATAAAPIPIPIVIPRPSSRIAIRAALVSSALMGTLAWNGLLIFIVGRVIQLW
jgi:hypothetical protein